MGRFGERGGQGIPCSFPSSGCGVVLGKRLPLVGDYYGPTLWGEDDCMVIMNCYTPKIMSPHFHGAEMEFKRTGCSTPSTLKLVLSSVKMLPPHL